MIQRTYRGWIGREKWRQLRHNLWKRKIAKTYKNERSAAKKEAIARERRREIVARYRKQRAEATVARMVGKTTYNSSPIQKGAGVGRGGGPGKMRLFQASPYATDVLLKRATQSTNLELAEHRRVDAAAAKRYERFLEVREKGAETDVFKMYYEPETTARRDEFLDRIEKLKARFSVIGPGKSYKDLLK